MEWRRWWLEENLGEMGLDVGYGMRFNGGLYFLLKIHLRVSTSVTEHHMV